MKTGVYKITNLVNGKVYIGASKDIERRWREHRRGLTAIAEDLQTFGLDNFKFEILLECPEDMLAQWERDMICLYDSDDPEKGYNNPKDRPYSLKVSESHKGKPAWNKNIPCSVEAKRKISRANKDRPKPPFSEEHKKKISEKMKGRPAWNKGRPGTPHSEEHKRKVSEAMCLYWQKKKENI